MALPKISASELIVAENHPSFADIKNRGGEYIQAQIEVEHSAAGVHDGRATGVHFEEGSYAGGGTASNEITLTNTNLNPFYVEVWYSHAVDLPVLTDKYGYDNYALAYGFPFTAAVIIQDCFPQDGYATGSFTVGAANNTNRNGSTFYYLIAGYELQDLSPTGGTDPTWVEHGDSLLGGAVGTEVANKVEKKIEDAWLIEHNDAGVHASTTFDFRIEEGNYTGNGVDNRVMSLTITDLDLKYLFIFIPAANDVLLKTEDLAGDNTKENDTAAFQANDIQDITTNGQFTIGDDLKVNAAEGQYLYIAIGV